MYDSSINEKLGDCKDIIQASKLMLSLQSGNSKYGQHNT